MNSHLLERNREKFKELNIINWQNRGINGKGVKVGIIGYSPKSHHNGAELIRQIVSDVEIIEYNVGDNDSFRYTWEGAFSQMLEDGVQVICSSLRTRTWSREVRALIEELYHKGVIMIDSSDNEGREIDAYPALDKHWFAIGVFDGEGRAGYSQYGETLLGLGYSNYVTKTQSGDYVPLSHTSGAVQVVSGIATMLKQINPRFTPEEFEKFVSLYAIKISNNHWNKFEGYGLISLPEDVPAWVKESNMEKFKDVNKTDWFYEAVKYATENGIMKGYKDGTFRPDQPLTRAEIAQIEYNRHLRGK